MLTLWSHSHYPAKEVDFGEAEENHQSRIVGVALWGPSATFSFEQSRACDSCVSRDENHEIAYRSSWFHRIGVPKFNETLSSGLQTAFDRISSQRKVSSGEYLICLNHDDCIAISNWSKLTAEDADIQMKGAVEDGAPAVIYCPCVVSMLNAFIYWSRFRLDHAVHIFIQRLMCSVSAFS